MRKRTTLFLGLLAAVLLSAGCAAYAGPGPSSADLYVENVYNYDVTVLQNDSFLGSVPGYNGRRVFRMYSYQGLVRITVYVDQTYIGESQDFSLKENRCYLLRVRKKETYYRYLDLGEIPCTKR